MNPANYVRNIVYIRTVEWFCFLLSHELPSSAQAAKRTQPVPRSCPFCASLAVCGSSDVIVLSHCIVVDCSCGGGGYLPPPPPPKPPMRSVIVSASCVSSFNITDKISSAFKSASVISFSTICSFSNVIDKIFVDSVT